MRILLVEDDAVISAELQLRWRAHGWMVHACARLSQADEALADTAAQGFELIVLDRGLPDGDGLDWLRRLRLRDRLTPTLVLTARDSVDDRVQGLQSGADDYLVKPFAAAELDARVEALLRRMQVVRGDMLSYGGITWRGESGVAFVGEEPMDLSPREFEVLGVLLRRAPRLVAKRALIDALAERNLNVGDSAAEVYVSRLRKKLAGSGAAIRTIRGFGYLLAMGEDEGAAGHGERGDGMDGDGGGAAGPA